MSKPAGIGHNSSKVAGIGHNSSKVGGIAADQLRSFVKRIERLEEEKATIAGDIREIFSEAKGNGFDTKVLRELIKLRKQDPADREEYQNLLDLYCDALGMGD